MGREVYFPRKLERQVEDVMSSTRVLFAGVVALGFALIFAGSHSRNQRSAVNGHGRRR